MKPLYFELISRNKPKVGIIRESFEEMEGRLFQILDKERVISIMESFREQVRVGRGMPNVILFLDENDQSISIDEFFKK